MKIAVAYEDGNVHPHFGQCTCVKIYEVENNAVVSTDVVDMSSAGHSMIARVIYTNGAAAVICRQYQTGCCIRT